MKLGHRIALIFAASIVSAASAHAEPAAPPTWEIHDLCGEAKKQECLNIENTGRLSVLARWSTVPEKDREACLEKIDRPGERSYRRLLDCFDDRAMKALEVQPDGR